MRTFDYSQIRNIEFEGIDYKDAPDYCDAFIANAEIDGKQLTQDQLDEVNEDADFIHEQLHKHLY